MRYLWILILCSTAFTQCLGDLNEDGMKNVLDVVMLVDDILTGDDQCEDFTDVCVDIDGNIYQTVQIGDQLWMSENLKTTHYNDGSEIPTGLDNSAWVNTTEGAYAYYNDDPSHLDTYGNLYNWYAVDEGDLCMEGWHVPSDEEFKELEMFLGMSEEEANSTGWRGTDESSKLAGNADLWNSGNLENNSEFGTSGFTGLPAGYRNYITGSYNYIGFGGYFWSSSEYGSGYVYCRMLDYGYSSVYRVNYTMQGGLSIRCLRD